MRVTKIVGANAECDIRVLERGLPHIEAEPVTRDVAVGVHCPSTQGVIPAGCAALGTVDGTRISAELASALSGVVPAQRAMPVAASCGIRFGESERCRIWENTQPRRWGFVRLVCRVGE